MKTYNFIVTLGKISQDIEIDANTEDEAIDIVQKEFPQNEGWYYILT